ncbi:MAG TPA: methyltransferase domain-containing protein, partial [Acidimicrobiales bacterium]|nr:methyltransferase domain-containing protein [Acidimicrobiales bacterium]
LWCNDLHDPTFDLRADVEEVVLRRMARRSADNVRDVGEEVRDGVRHLRQGIAATLVRAFRSVRWAVARGAAAVVQGAIALRYGVPRLYWRVVLRTVVPVVDVLRRAGRSLARRARVLAGREASPGGRRDAVRFPKGWRERPLSSAEVEAYYDDWHERYVAAFGDVLQTFRSQDPTSFLLELGELAGLRPGQRVLDAGCGVGGPALRYAEHFNVRVDGVTLSQPQVDEARRRVEAAGLAGRVQIHKGDFHRLEDLFDPATFDVVYFLEALCHSDHPRIVLASVRTVLKPGGVVFVKDLFRNRGSSQDEEADIEVAVRNTEHHCHLNVWPREVVLEALRDTGFEVELDRPFELYPDFDYDTGNDFVNDNDIDIFEGRPSTYLQHAAIRARVPPA